MIRLGGLLRLLASHGGGEIRAADVAAALDADGHEVRSALAAHGILRGAPRALTVPCDGLGCAREVRELAYEGEGKGATRRLFGVCTREPEECEMIDVSEIDVAQETISRDAFVAAVQRALRVAPHPDRMTLRPRDAADAVLLGEEIVDGKRRDVVLAWHPESPVLRALVAEAELAGRAMRVLTLDAVADLLTVRDGQIAEVPRLEVVVAPLASPGAPANATAPSEPPPPVVRSRALDGFPFFQRWGEVTLFDVDDDSLIGVAHEGLLRRLSCVDLGLAYVNGRHPLDSFGFLKTICSGNGLFTTRAYGSQDNGKRLVKEVRIALRATFGIQDDPFERYSRVFHNWKPKFRALAAAPKVVEAAVRTLEKKER